MLSSEIRERYLRFFEERNSKRVQSSSLIPDDPSMLLTSAGMVQFKPYFLQQKHLEPQYVGATSVQKCLRTSDIDNIGRTGRHLSFFEMLGNFSFGEYFKDEMCKWALEFSEDELGLERDRIYISIYLDDDECYKVWRALGIEDSHIVRLGDEDNFWSAGSSGPCGPCSELYYDQGEAFGCDSPDCAPGCDCDRYLEYWNLVFTQYDKQEDGTLIPLPKKNIDTGMGLERVAAMLQGAHNNFESDILSALIDLGAKLSGRLYGKNEADDKALKIIADHGRAITFMIADGILPSNEGRGYILRRLLRRAIRYGALLGIMGLFLKNFALEVLQKMGDVYPELLENRELIIKVIESEEEKFGRTLANGQAYLDSEIERLKQGETLSGEAAFLLHDTYGFPYEITVEICEERNIIVDAQGFMEQMQAQKERARLHAKDDAWGTFTDTYMGILDTHGKTEFLGYGTDAAEAKVIAIIVDACQLDVAKKGQKAELILDKTPFYGELGGQLGDTGQILSVTLSADDANLAPEAFEAPETPKTPETPGFIFDVLETQITNEGLTTHIGNVLEGEVFIGDSVMAKINALERRRIERNHTATHILHKSLSEILGEHVKQAGSLVTPTHLRFDFTHFEAMTNPQIQEVEDIVNKRIMEAHIVNNYETTLDSARKSGVVALFGEKYGENVRVLECGDFSRELCGGTHVGNTVEIGFFKILSESSIGSNIRRIEAVTSFDALAYVNKAVLELKGASFALKCAMFEVEDRATFATLKVRELEKESQKLKAKNDDSQVDELIAPDKLIDAGYPLVIAEVKGETPNDLKALWDKIKTRLTAPGAAVLVATSHDGKVSLVAAASDEAVAAGFDAGAIIKQIAPLVDGRGGGKAQMAQAGGTKVNAIPEALKAAFELLVR